MYCLLALQLAKELNASVICPDYTTYPKVQVFFSYFNDIKCRAHAVHTETSSLTCLSGECFKYGPGHK